jgi:hypothetical protein
LYWRYCAAVLRRPGLVRWRGAGHDRVEALGLPDSELYAVGSAGLRELFQLTCAAASFDAGTPDLSWGAGRASVVVRSGGSSRLIRRMRDVIEGHVEEHAVAAGRPVHEREETA